MNEFINGRKLGISGKVGLIDDIYLQSFPF